MKNILLGRESIQAWFRGFFVDASFAVNSYTRSCRVITIDIYVSGSHIKRMNERQYDAFDDNRTNYHSKFEQGTRIEFN